MLRAKSHFSKYMHQKILPIPLKTTTDLLILDIQNETSLNYIFMCVLKMLKHINIRYLGADHISCKEKENNMFFYYYNTINHN